MTDAASSIKAKSSAETWMQIHWCV